MGYVDCKKVTALILEIIIEEALVYQVFNRFDIRDFKEIIEEEKV